MIGWILKLFFRKPPLKKMPPPVHSDLQELAARSMETGEPIEALPSSVEFPPFDVPERVKPSPTGLTCQANRYNCERDATVYLSDSLARMDRAIALCDYHAKSTASENEGIEIVGTVGEETSDLKWRLECEEFARNFMQRRFWFCPECKRRKQTIEVAPHCRECEVFLNLEETKRNES